MSHRTQREDCKAIAEQRARSVGLDGTSHPSELANAGRRAASQQASSPVRRHGIDARGGLIVLSAALALAACASSEEANVADADGAAVPVAAQPPIDPAVDPAEPVAPTAETVLTAQGWGPLTIGMTLAEITAALGPDSDPGAVGGADPEACDQFRPERAPEGMLVMVEQGRLSRISLIRDATVKTDKGLTLGVPAAAVRAAYGETLREAPHKYVEKPAEYLTVWAVGGAAPSTTGASAPGNGTPPPNSRGIQYEVNATGNVAAIHAGGPSIMYVEGCA